MIRSSWKFGNNIDEVTDIRKSVGDVQSDSDEKSIQLILYDGDTPAACGSLYFGSGAYRIAHCCVRPELQKKYLGDMLVRLLLFRGFNMMAEKIVIQPTPETVGFFSRYGFSRVDDFMEVTPQTLKLEGKCGHDCSTCVNKDTCGK